MNEDHTKLKDYMWSRSIDYSVEEIEACCTAIGN